MISADASVGIGYVDRMSRVSHTLHYGVAQPQEYKPALELVLRDLLPSARATLVESLSKVESCSLGAFDALVVARQGDDLVGAAWAQPHPGNTATLWRPVERGVQLCSVAQPLLREIGLQTDQAGISMSQALLESDDDPLAKHLYSSQFVHLAELSYLNLDLGQRPLPNASDGRSRDVDFERYGGSNHHRFKRILAETYADSLDCPELDGRRDLEDVLAGYRAIGSPEGRVWSILRRNGEDLGVLLTSVHDNSQSELVYMGLRPEARGDGLGGVLIGEAVRQAQAACSDKLLVAVDARNGPAKQAYERHGFTPWACRHVLVRWRGGEA